MYDNLCMELVQLSLPMGEFRGTWISRTLDFMHVFCCCCLFLLLGDCMLIFRDVTCVPSQRIRNRVLAYGGRSDC